MKSRLPVLFAVLSALLFAPFAIAVTPQLTAALPLYFEQNLGQAPTRYSYIAHEEGMKIGFLRNGVDLLVPTSNQAGRLVHLALVGGEADPKGQDLLQGRTNYLRGNDPSHWIKGVSDYRAVQYKDVYRGISLSFYGNGAQLEHDFELDAGADPSQIAFRLDGAERVDLTKEGNLEVHLGKGTLTLRKPIAYQEGDFARRHVDAAFLLSDDGEIRFRLGEYDTNRPLVIDPVFTFSTYLAGTGTDTINAVTTDKSGNIYVTGSTTSTDFQTANAEQPTLCGTSGGSCQDAFVSKLGPTGKTLIYSTYLGGSTGGLGFAIQVDGSGDAIVAGIASSGFPNAGAIQSPACQINDGCYFLASLKPDGSALNYSGLIGGSEGDYTNSYNGGLAVDASGAAYLAGITDDSAFQTTTGTLSPMVPGYPYNTMFVLKVDATGKLIYSTAVPGNAAQNPSEVFTNSFFPAGISVDSLGEVTVSGTGGLGLQTTAGVVSPNFPNDVNAESAEAGFVLQLNATASALNFASYLPGTDICHGLAVGSNGTLYLTGATSETTLPVSANAYQKTPTASAFGGVFSGYILELSAKATSVVAATYLDGTQATNDNESSSFSGIALDSTGNVFVGGSTGSTDFPLVDPFVTQLETGGNIEDALILAEMNADLSSLLFGSFLTATDGALTGAVFSGLAVDATNNLVVVGTTTALDFPTTAGSFEPQPPPPVSPYSSPQHSFISKIDLAVAAPSVCLNTQNVALGNVPANTSANSTLQVTNCGNAPLTFASLTSSAPTVVASQSCGAIAPGSVCSVKLTYTPVDSTAVSGTLTLSDNAVISSQTVSFMGQGEAAKIVAQPASVSFGHLLVGTSSPATTVYLSNQGNAQLSISAITVNGSGFSLVSSQGCTTLQYPYGACIVQVQFAPQSASSLTGILAITSNDPVNPTLTIPLTGSGDSTYAVPVISSIGAGTFQINNGPMPVTVAGTGFYPQSVVEVGGVPQTTTYQSGTSLQASIAASSLTSLGELPLTVVNPTPGGGQSAAMTITPYETLVIAPSAVVSVPSTGMLYAAIPASASNNPNTVIPVNPTTGALGTPIPVGNNPILLAASGDGKYLYVALSVDQTVQRINLQTMAVERTFPYGPNPYCPTCELGLAQDLHVVPGNSQEVVLSQGFVISLYNDSGLISYAPTSYVYYNAPTFDSFAIPGSAPTTIYSLPFTTIQNPYFTVAALTGDAITYTPFMGNNYGPPSGTGNQVITDGTLLYTNGGEVWNPATAEQVGSFISTSYDTPSITLDSANLYGIGYQSYGGGDALVLSAWALGSYQLTNNLAFSQVDYQASSSLVRWGTDGFAFIAAGPGQVDQELYLIRSSVSGQPSTNPVPVATSLTPASIASGGPAFSLAVNGTGFAITSVVTLNGTAVPTTFVSSVQLSAAIPASAISAIGTAQIVVTSPSPGGGTSSAITLTIGSPVPALQSISPRSAVAGSAVFTLTATGTGFIEGSALNWNGAALPTTYASSTQLTAAVPASDVAASATAQVTVTNPTPDGGTSAAVAFMIFSLPQVSLSPTALSFGDIVQGSTSAAQSISLQNTGGSPLSITAITGSGPFTSTNTCGANLSAGATCVISVIFAPITAGAATGSIVITDNATGSPQMLALSGTGVAAVAVGTATEGSTTASVSSGATVTYNLAVSASPGFAGSVALSCNGAPQYATCTIAPSTVILAAAGSANFTVTVTTASTQNAFVKGRPAVFAAGFGLLSLLVLPGLFSRKIRIQPSNSLLCLLAVLMVFGFIGCAGSGDTSHQPTTLNTPAGTYTLNVIGTAGGNSVTTPLTLVVH